MEAVQFMKAFTVAVGAVVTLLYLYQFGYMIVGLFRRKPRADAVPQVLRKYAAVISARNEEAVIGELIGSLKKQKYPAALLDIYVIADNCTDDTAAVAARAGARVLRRFDKRRVGKGYALDFFFHCLMDWDLDGQYAGYMIFDADNLVDKNFVYEMNRCFNSGDFDAVTSYRNSKNFGSNWISAGYSIWFLREARFLNGPRMALGTNCTVSGTGFLVSEAAIRRNDGWPFHLLTEDVEFSVNATVAGFRIGYCASAVIYDEQPTGFRQAWDQRLRWSKGFYQVDGRYAGAMLKNIVKGGRKGFSCYDILMTVTPGVLLTGGVLAINLLLCLACITQPAYIAHQVLLVAGAGIGGLFGGFYQSMLLCGAVTVLCEWKNIRASAWQKLGYLVVFPLFMLTYLLISVVALFRKVEWTPILHKSKARLNSAA